MTTTEQTAASRLPLEALARQLVQPMLLWLPCAP
jgi:hypothetical protein